MSIVQYQWKNLEKLVLQYVVELMQIVSKIMVYWHAFVRKDILEIHCWDVVQNVLSTQIVLQIKHVLTISVLIHVLVHVEFKHSVKLLIIIQFATVPLITQEMHLNIAHQYVLQYQILIHVIQLLVVQIVDV